MGGDVLSQVTLAPMKAVSVAYRPDGDSDPRIVPKRSLYGDNLYPEISATSLPYGDGKTVVIDGDFDVTNINSQNITTITKTPPPEPVDEMIVLGPTRSLTEEITDRGVTKEAAQALVQALNGVFPAQMAPGARFELTLDRQLDFYGREVIFPVQLTFKPGPKETIIVEADEDGRFRPRLTAKRSAPCRATRRSITSAPGPRRLEPLRYGQDNKVPGYIISELTRVFAYDVDFQRQVKASDTFEVFYGNPLTGSSSKRKVLHYAQLTLRARPRRLFRFTTADGLTDYYDDQGRQRPQSRCCARQWRVRVDLRLRYAPSSIAGLFEDAYGRRLRCSVGTPIRAAGTGVIADPLGDWRIWHHRQDQA